MINKIKNENHNAIQENFEIRKILKELFRSSESSPVYQLKKHYPEIYEKIHVQNQLECNNLFQKNLEKGIKEGLYRADIDINSIVAFYYYLITAIRENTLTDEKSHEIKVKALEYHTRAIATEKGILELEKNLNQSQLKQTLPP